MSNDIQIQIQTLKSQIENMKLQIDNIEMQNQNMNQMMMGSIIGEQLLNLSIQLFNAGIQTFNTSKILVMNIDKYIQQLKKVSEQINSIITDYEGMNMMQMPPMMGMPVNQGMGQIPMQQMQMQMMMMNQMNMMEQMSNPIELDKINVTFDNVNGEKEIISVEKGTKVKDLFAKYVNEVYGLINKDFIYLYNGQRISRRDERKVEDVFINNEFPRITVTEM